MVVPSSASSASSTSPRSASVASVQALVVATHLDQILHRPVVVFANDAQAFVAGNQAADRHVNVGSQA